MNTVIPAVNRLVKPSSINAAAHPGVSRPTLRDCAKQIHLVHRRQMADALSTAAAAKPTTATTTPTPTQS